LLLASCEAAPTGRTSSGAASGVEKNAAASTSVAGSTAAGACPAPIPTIDPGLAARPSALTTTATAENDVGEVPLAVKLSVEIQEGTGRPPFRHVWDFGDATPFSTEASPTHGYLVPGNFRPSVITVDADGQVDQDSVDVLALANFETLGLTTEQAREQIEAARERARKALEKTAGASGAAGQH